VNHFLLLPQITFRLECIIKDKAPPFKGTTDAENIILRLSEEPRSFLSRDVVHCLLALDEPLLRISEDDRHRLREQASMADEGISGAVTRIIDFPRHPIDHHSISMLRIALSIIDKELSELGDGGYHVLKSLWKTGSHDLMSHLADDLAAASCHIDSQFSLTTPKNLVIGDVSRYFLTVHEILSLLMRLIPTFPIPGRTIRSLSCHAANIFRCTDAADMLYSQASDTCTAAQLTRQTCIDFIRELARLPADTGGSECSSCETVLRALLHHGLKQSSEHDPVYHLLQVFSLIDHLLPADESMDDERGKWAHAVLPNVLQDLTLFFRALDTENKVHMVKRLVNLDGGIVGVGEWLVIQESRHLSNRLQSLGFTASPGPLLTIGQYDIALTLRFFCDLLSPSSSASGWCISTFSSIVDAGDALGEALIHLVDQGYLSSLTAEIMHALAESDDIRSVLLRTALAILLFRTVQANTDQHSHGSFAHPFMLAARHLTSMDEQPPHSGLVESEVGATLSVLGALSADTLEDSIALSVFQLVSCLVKWSDSCRISVRSHSSFMSLLDAVGRSLPPDRTQAFMILRTKIQAEERCVADTTDVPLPASVTMPMQDIAKLLHPDETFTPSTPVQKPLMHIDDAFGVTVSPPTSLLRSPAVSKTKTYVGDDFRSSRLGPSGRQNTSRLPSTHVDVSARVSSS
jgi:hypothetical protein